MIKLVLSTVIAVLFLLAGSIITPPQAATLAPQPQTASQENVSTDVSAQRRRHVRRHYHGPRYRYVRPYRYYGPGPYAYYRPYYRPAPVVPFPFFPFFW